MDSASGLSAAFRDLAPRLLVTATPGSRGSEALAAGLAACAAGERGALLIVLGEVGRARRPTLLASPAARRLEEALGGTSAGAAARGLVCHLTIPDGAEGVELAAQALRRVPATAIAVVHVEPGLWIAAVEHPGLAPAAALFRADLPDERALAALAVRDLRGRGIAVRVAKRPLGWAAARRGLAGVRVGGQDEIRLRRWARVLRLGA